MVWPNCRLPQLWYSVEPSANSVSPHSYEFLAFTHGSSQITKITIVAECHGLSTNWNFWADMEFFELESLYLHPNDFGKNTKHKSWLSLLPSPPYARKYFQTLKSFTFYTDK
jgi:hypothetical protein